MTLDFCSCSQVACLSVALALCTSKTRPVTFYCRENLVNGTPPKIHLNKDIVSVFLVICSRSFLPGNRPALLLGIPMPNCPSSFLSPSPSMLHTPIRPAAQIGTTRD